MLLVFRLPFLLLELVVRQGVRGLGLALRVLRGGGAEEEAYAPTAPPPAWRREAGAEPVEEESVTLEEEAAGYGPDSGFGPRVEEPPPPPPPTAAEAVRRRREREAVDRVAPPVTEPEPAAPLRGVEAEGHVDSEPTLVESFGPADEVGSGMTVDEPWDGYDGMPATAVVARLRGADEATRAVVRLYEQTHKQRQTILRATG